SSVTPGIERCHGDRLGEIPHVYGLEIAPSRDDRKEGQPRHRSKAIGEIIFGAENQRWSDDGGVWKGLADYLFTLALGATVVRFRIGVGRDCRDVDQGSRTSLS